MQTYFFTGPSYESQLFHHVHVTGIPYGKKCAPSPPQSAHMRLLLAISRCKDVNVLLVSRAALSLTSWHKCKELQCLGTLCRAA